MRQVRTIRYRDIADDLRGRVDAGEFTAGRVLPSESDLSGHYSASRVTVRKALETLRGDGLIDSRQGFGWFVAAETVRQPLVQLATIEEQLEAEGKRSERRILEFAFIDAPQNVQQILGCDRVLMVRRLTLADGAPFARVTVWCPQALGAALSRDQVEQQSFYDLLPIPIAGAVQVIGAGAADVDDGELLAVPVGSPTLVCERTTRTADQQPVLYAQHVFAAHRTEFVVDLADPAASIAPSGIHLLR